MSLKREFLATFVVAALVIFRCCIGSEHFLAPNLTMVVTICIIQFFSLLSTLAGLKGPNDLKKVGAGSPQIGTMVMACLGSVKASAKSFTEAVQEHLGLTCVAGFSAVLAMMALMPVLGFSKESLEVRFEIFVAFLMGGGARWLAVGRREAKAPKDMPNMAKVQGSSVCSHCGDPMCDGTFGECPYDASFWGEIDVKHSYEQHEQPQYHHLHQQHSSSRPIDDRSHHQEQRQQYYKNHQQQIGSKSPKEQNDQKQQKDDNMQRHFNVQQYQQLVSILHQRDPAGQADDRHRNEEKVHRNVKPHDHQTNQLNKWQQLDNMEQLSHQQVQYQNCDGLDYQLYDNYGYFHCMQYGQCDQQEYCDPGYLQYYGQCDQHKYHNPQYQQRSRHQVEQHNAYQYHEYNEYAEHCVYSEYSNYGECSGYAKYSGHTVGKNWKHNECKEDGWYSEHSPGTKDSASTSAGSGSFQVQKQQKAKTTKMKWVPKEAAN